MGGDALGKASDQLDSLRAMWTAAAKELGVGGAGQGELTQECKHLINIEITKHLATKHLLSQST